MQEVKEKPHNNFEKRKKNSARLIWDTKPKRSPNPRDIEFQTAEIVIPNPHRDQMRLTGFMTDLTKTVIDKSKMNRLIWGDNLLAMQALLSSGYEEKIDLIYIDPPFWTGENYYANVRIGHNTVTKSPSIIERLAYKDYWEGGIDSYLDMLYPRLRLMKLLLSEKGVLAIHTDWHVGHYVKILADEVFGRDNFQSEIIWKRRSGMVEQKKTFGSCTDFVLLYSKTDKYTYVRQFTKVGTEDYVRERFKYVDEKGRRYKLDNLANPGIRPTLVYEYKGYAPPPQGWAVSRKRMEQFDQEGRLYFPKDRTQRLKRKQFFDEWKGRPIQNLWDDLYQINPMAKEKLEYPTQKPESVLERIIESSSVEGDLVADFFCGSGTTLTVAERLKRKWIGCDFSKLPVQMTRNRLVNMNSQPFLVENIGNYQRQMVYLSGARIYEMQTVVLKLYGATPRKDQPDLGMRKTEEGIIELVYVGYPDRPITAKRAFELGVLADRLDGTGYKRLVILGWDYEYNYDDLLQERLKHGKEFDTEIVSKAIPPEIYDYLRKAKTVEDIEPLRDKIFFHEKPYLKLSKPRFERISTDEAKVTIGIERYVLFDYPIEDEDKRDEIREIIKKNFAAIIDYWAVDWEYDGETFKSVWQAFRGFADRIRDVPLSTSYQFKREPNSKHIIAVRVVDIFGNDASSYLTIDTSSA